MGELISLATSAARSRSISEKVLTFSVSDEEYALGIRDIKEIIEYGGVTRVPMVGAQIRGVLNLRGRIVPVIDLAHRLALPSDGRVGRRACVVVLDIRDGDEVLELGIAVDAVNQVLSVNPDDLQPAPGFGTRIRDDFIVSMARLGEKFVVILDQERVLAVAELAEEAAPTNT